MCSRVNVQRLQVCMDTCNTKLALRPYAYERFEGKAITRATSNVKIVAKVGQMMCLRCATRILRSVPSTQQARSDVHAFKSKAGGFAFEIRSVAAERNAHYEISHD